MIAVQYLLFIIVVLLFAVAYPLSGYHQQRWFTFYESGRVTKKIKWYYNTILWAWIPTIAVITVMLITGFRLRHLGLKTINLSESGFDDWLIYALLFLYTAYICYNIFTYITLRINPETRSISISQIPLRIRPLLPVNRTERRVWALVSVTAGITE
ncbi:MAG: hypothetical protein PHT63_03725, partial [Bacteroidales bacterium]|nr:hypothetical protein [Bacteroidales bacterium]